MGLVYRQPGYRRLDFGAWFSLGMLWPYLNYFKDYQRKGVEMWWSPNRRLGFLSFAQFMFALWRSPEKPRVRIHNHPMYPDGYILLSFLWFGLAVRCPRWVIRWKRRQLARENERMAEEYAKLYPEESQPVQIIICDCGYRFDADECPYCPKC